jgi:TusA-related sulfurtransferase
MPIIKLGAAVRAVPVGDSVRVVADDKGFTPDVRAWCAKTGHELVSLNDTDPAALVAVVRRLH